MFLPPIPNPALSASQILVMFNKRQKGILFSHFEPEAYAPGMLIKYQHLLMIYDAGLPNGPFLTSMMTSELAIGYEDTHIYLGGFVPVPVGFRSLEDPLNEMPYKHMNFGMRMKDDYQDPIKFLSDTLSIIQYIFLVDLPGIDAEYIRQTNIELDEDITVDEGEVLVRLENEDGQKPTIFSLSKSGDLEFDQEEF